MEGPPQGGPSHVRGRNCPVPCRASKKTGKWRASFLVMTSRTAITRPHDQTPVCTIMRLWPKTIRLFMARGMACVGCPVGGLHTLEEACDAHHVDLEPLLAEITEVARTTRARFPERGLLPQG